MKKITKKWTAFLFVCLLVVGSLSACGQNGGANAGNWAGREPEHFRRCGTKG